MFPARSVMIGKSLTGPRQEIGAGDGDWKMILRMIGITASLIGCPKQANMSDLSEGVIEFFFMYTQKILTCIHT